MPVKPENNSFIHPRYWLTHVSLLVLKLIGKMPSTWRKKLGLTLGWLMLKLAKKRYRIAKINLGLCFPDLNKDQLEKLVEDNMAATGCGLIETAACWYSHLEKQQSNLKLIGKENLDNALQKGKGVILLSYHMTSLEMGGCLLGAHYDFLAMYKPNKNPLFEKAMCDGRLRHLKGLLNRNNLRGTVKALKSNQIVWYATDQNYGGKTSVFVPFFNIQTATITATTKLSKMTGAAVVPFTQRRLEGTDQFELVLYPALDNFPGSNEQEDAARINAFLENYLKQYPVDYMWLHQRFRTRPDGEKPIY